MPDSKGNGWMTTREAAELLGLTEAWVLQALRREGVEESRRPNGQNRSLLWNRAQVEQVFTERQPTKEKKAAGLKRCGACRQWKDKATEFHRRYFVCKGCRPAYDAERKKQNRKTFANRNPDRQPPGPVGLFVAVGKPPTMETAKKYACMMGFFQHRPLPIVDGKRVSKRDAFCSTCTAPQCMHHPHLKPAAVRRMKRVPLRPMGDWA